MKQTAVEWLMENSHIIPKNELNKKELIKKAKEMDKKDKHSEYMRGWKDGYSKIELKSE